MKPPIKSMGRGEHMGTLMGDWDGDTVHRIKVTKAQIFCSKCGAEIRTQRTIGSLVQCKKCKTIGEIDGE